MRILDRFKYAIIQSNLFEIQKKIEIEENCDDIKRKNCQNKSMNYNIDMTSYFFHVKLTKNMAVL